MLPLCSGAVSRVAYPAPKFQLLLDNISSRSDDNLDRIDSDEFQHSPAMEKAKHQKTALYRKLRGICGLPKPSYSFIHSRLHAQFRAPTFYRPDCTLRADKFSCSPILTLPREIASGRHSRYCGNAPETFPNCPNMLCAKDLDRLKFGERSPCAAFKAPDCLDHPVFRNSKTAVSMQRYPATLKIV